MVRAIENRARVSGRVTAVEADPARPGHVLVTVALSGAETMDGWPNLVAPSIGREVRVVARAQSALAASQGQAVSFVASLERPGLLVERSGE